MFNDILNQHAPIKSIKVKGKPNPCVNENIRALMKTRDHWCKLAQRSNDPLAWSAYRNFRGEVKREIKLAEREFVLNQIEKDPGNSNNIWKSIRLCIPKKSSSQRIFSQDEKTVAEEFNNFFASVGNNAVHKINDLANEFGFDCDRDRFTPRQYPLTEQFSFKEVEPAIVGSIISSMPNNKAPGSDKIPIRVIKDCIVPILPVITSIINTSLTTSAYPIVWKIAEVTPIPKGKDHPEVANNNRPISLLPVLSKVCERVAYNQFVEYLTLKKRLSSKQSGNKRGFSTETLLINITDSILNAIDQKKVTSLVLLDMSKAFDCVNHNLLMSKLQDMGGSQSCLQWFSSYLSNRQQVVRINSTVSDALPLTNGVPQGSILGPLLFNIYVNDLSTAPQNCDPHCYVDDTGLLHSFKAQSKSFAIENINEDLTKVRNWCFSNCLLLNPEKTKLLVFGSRQMLSRLQDFSLTLLGKEINPIEMAKDLGVTLDVNLTYNHHINKTVST
ncbi:Hypothetical predicted protein, partial [Paramuricea clavata]